MSRMMRWIAIPAVLLVLTVGTAQAWPGVPARPAHAAPAAENVLETAWKLLIIRLRPAKPQPPEPARSNSPVKNTCSADPNGRLLFCN